MEEEDSKADETTSTKEPTIARVEGERADTYRLSLISLSLPFARRETRKSAYSTRSKYAPLEGGEKAKTKTAVFSIPRRPILPLPPQPIQPPPNLLNPPPQTLQIPSRALLIPPQTPLQPLQYLPQTFLTFAKTRDFGLEGVEGGAEGGGGGVEGT